MSNFMQQAQLAGWQSTVCDGLIMIIDKAEVHF